MYMKGADHPVVAMKAYRRAKDLVDAVKDWEL
jgi:hypothetical protein